MKIYPARQIYDKLILYKANKILGEKDGTSVRK